MNHFKLAVALVTSILIYSSSVLAQEASEGSDQKPNFVFFLVDDLGWMDIGANGSSFYETPNIDKLAGCLLYTSPSPRDKRQSRMPSSA